MRSIYIILVVTVALAVLVEHTTYARKKCNIDKCLDDCRTNENKMKAKCTHEQECICEDRVCDPDKCQKDCYAKTGSETYRCTHEDLCKCKGEF